MSTNSTEYPIRLGRGFKKDSEELSLRLRRDLGLSSYDRMAARALANHFQMRVRYPEQLPSMSASCLAGLGVSGGKQSWSAVLITPEAHPGLIITNPHHNEVREESNIFHELAHHICGHKPMSIRLVGGLPFREFDKHQESQAEYLGYALHLNKESLFYCLKNGLDDTAICERYRASTQLLRYRLYATQAKRILRLV